MRQNDNDSLMISQYSLLSKLMISESKNFQIISTKPRYQNIVLIQIKAKQRIIIHSNNLAS